MKLFLTSYRAGRHAQELIKLLDGIKQFAFISNAKDYKTAAERKKSLSENFAYYHSIGLEPVEIDLKPHFHKRGAEKLLAQFKYVFLAGGNAFLLRRALKYTGLDQHLVKRVKEGSLIYGGESAGTIVAGPTLRGSEDPSTLDHEEDPHYIPEGYDKKVLWNGLGLIDFVLVPHYQAPGIAESIEGYVNYLKRHKIPHKTIREEEVMVVDGNKAELLK